MTEYELISKDLYRKVKKMSREELIVLITKVSTAGKGKRIDWVVEKGNVTVTPLSSVNDGLTHAKFTMPAESITINAVVVTPSPDPENIKITAKRSGELEIKWDAVQGADKYRILRRNPGFFDYVEVATVTTTSYIDTGLTNNHQYWYQIQACVNGVWGGSSNTMSYGGTPLDITPPSIDAPTNLRATAGDGSVTLTWNAVKGAESYVVYIVSENSKDSRTFTGTSGTIIGLTNGVEYGFFIYAYANGELSYASDMVYATPKAAAASTKPENLKAVAGAKKVTLAWDAVKGATMYRVRRSDGKSWATVANPTTNSYVDTAVTNGTTYTYTIYAYVNGAFGELSNYVRQGCIE